MVRVKVWVMLPMDAVTVTVPDVAPAVTVTCARPVASLGTEVADRVAPPVRAKLTGWPTTGWPFVPLTCTISGALKFCPAWALC